MVLLVVERDKRARQTRTTGRRRFSRPSAVRITSSTRRTRPSSTQDAAPARQAVDHRGRNGGTRHHQDRPGGMTSPGTAGHRK
ncbi:hypothetical protein DUI70_6065 [Streptomyces albus]|nr:hypothetical protein DUI70_6065 [Streptomyces albus]